MIAEFSLPYRSIEGSSTVGPFFWVALEPGDPQLPASVGPTLRMFWQSISLISYT